MNIEDAAEDAAELKKVEEMDAVNEESKAALSDALADKIAVQKQVNKVLYSRLPEGLGFPPQSC